MSSPSLLTAAVATTWIVVALWVVWAFASALVRAARDTAPSVSQFGGRVADVTSPPPQTEAA